MAGCFRVGPPAIYPGRFVRRVVIGGCRAPVFYIFAEVTLISRDLRVNERIRAREVRLIDGDGQQLGVMPLEEALQRAYERGLDLVEVAPNARPVVCRIMDYGKFKYEQAKKDREARRHQKVITVKEVKMRPNINEHDFQVKLRNALRFLSEGAKVKCSIMFRGREIVRREKGRQVLERLAEELAEHGVVERHPTMEGRNMVMVMAPKADKSAG